MQTFINEELLAAARHQEKRRALLFRSLCALTAAAVVAECLLTRTGNAALMLRVLYATLIFPGLICIVFYLFALQPARRRISHLEGLLNREPEEREGRLTLTADAFRIPKSVPVRIVLLDTGEETLRLNLDEEWAPLAPPDGTLVRLRIVGKSVIGIQPTSDTEPRTDVPRPARFRRILRGFGAVLPALILWVMLALVVGGFVFNQITDTSPAHKITLFADAELNRAAELAEKLENALSGPIRMVKIHPFSYALFGGDTIRGADLYIVPASHVEEYREWFAPLPAEFAAEEAADMPGGMPVFDPAGGLAVAGDYILYEAEPYYLFFGAASPHLSETDRTAVDAARALLRD